jgi:hypothetical protein
MEKLEELRDFNMQIKRKVSIGDREKMSWRKRFPSTKTPSSP